MHREQFARVYVPVVRAYLTARWESRANCADLDDTVQEVFVECFRGGGVLEKVAEDPPADFSAFLYGVTRNVARRVEQRRQRERESRAELPAEQVEADDTSLSKVFDRAWARSIVQEAAVWYAERAQRDGEEAMKRVELLHLRFYEDLPIREIAKRWGVDVDRLHGDYRRARHEFQGVLREVLAFYRPGSAVEATRECARLLALVD